MSETPTVPVSLESLASRHFKNLTQAEIKLLRAAPKAPPEANRADCGPNSHDTDPHNDPSKSQDWSKDREIRAELIRWLCVDRDVAKQIDPRGVGIFAGKIVGKLDLAFVKDSLPIAFCSCDIVDQIDLTSATVSSLDLTNSRLKSLYAWNATIDHDLILDNIHCTDGIDLRGIKVGGQVQCIGSVISNGINSPTLDFGRAELKGSVQLKNTVSHGEVRFLRSTIGGHLECDGATVFNLTGTALTLELSKIEGSVYLRDGFQAAGTVNSQKAVIGRDLDCAGGIFLGDTCNALLLDAVRVGRNVLMGLADDGGKFLKFRQFQAYKHINLTSAEIDGNLRCSGGRFTHLSLQDTKVKGTFFWENVTPIPFNLILTDASIHHIKDCPPSWPETNRLMLNGLVYDTIEPLNAQSRLVWLAREGSFRPQPYQQLAKILLASGDQSGAKRVRYEMQVKKWAAEARYKRWTIGQVYRGTVGYGIYPELATVYLLLLVGLGWLVHWRAYRMRMMVPRDREAYAEFTHGDLHQSYPRFSPFLYSLENTLPVVSFGQDDKWQPVPSPRGIPSHRETLSKRALPAIKNMREWFVTTALAPGRLCVDLIWLWRHLISPPALRFYRFVMIMAGWLLAIFVGAALSGIIDSN